MKTLFLSIVLFSMAFSFPIITNEDSSSIYSKYSFRASVLSSNDSSYCFTQAIACWKYSSIILNRFNDTAYTRVQLSPVSKHRKDAIFINRNFTNKWYAFPSGNNADSFFVHLSADYNSDTAYTVDTVIAYFQIGQFHFSVTIPYFYRYVSSSPSPNLTIDQFLNSVTSQGFYFVQIYQAMLTTKVAPAYNKARVPQHYPQGSFLLNGRKVNKASKLARELLLQIPRL